MRPLPTALLALLGACATPALPPGLAALLPDAPSDQPVLLAFADGRLWQCSVPRGPGALDQQQRTAVEAAVAGGRTLRTASEWGPRGQGFRVDKQYGDGPGAQFGSVLIDAAGHVLERSHSLALADTPPAVLATALAAGCRDVERVDVVSGPAAEEGFRLLAHDGGGRTFLIECDLQGGLRSRARVLPAGCTVR